MDSQVPLVTMEEFAMVRHLVWVVFGILLLQVSAGCARDSDLCSYSGLEAVCGHLNIDLYGPPNLQPRVAMDAVQSRGGTVLDYQESLRRIRVKFDDDVDLESIRKELLQVPGVKKVHFLIPSVFQ